MACSPGPRAAATADFGNWRVPARLTAWLRSWRSLTWLIDVNYFCRLPTIILAGPELAEDAPIPNGQLV